MMSARLFLAANLVLIALSAGNKAGASSQQTPEPQGKSSAVPDGAPPTLESIEKTLLAKWDQVRTLSAVINTVHEGVRGDTVARRDGHGSYHLLKKDGKTFVRMEINSKSVAQGETSVVGPAQNMLTVCDGDAIYFQRDVGGRAQVYKMGLDHSEFLELGGPRFFAKLRRFTAVKVLPDETVNARETYVLQATFDNTGSTTLYFLDKQTGILAKMVQEMPKDQTSKLLTVSEIRLNVDLKKDLFRYAPPAGVEVRDLTKKTEQEKAEP